MPDIFLKCGSCGKHLVVDDALAGQRIKCPDCNAASIVTVGLLGQLCPQCQTVVRASKTMEGETARCPQCASNIYLRHVEPPAAPQSSGGFDNAKDFQASKQGLSISTIWAITGLLVGVVATPQLCEVLHLDLNDSWIGEIFAFITTGILGGIAGWFLSKWYEVCRKCFIAHPRLMVVAKAVIYVCGISWGIYFLFEDGAIHGDRNKCA